MNGGDAVFAIDGEMTIYRAVELKQALLPAADAPQRVDLSAVSEIDSAGVQLLLLAQREAQATGRGWQLVAVSGAVAEVLDLLGLRPTLCGATSCGEACHES